MSTTTLPDDLAGAEPLLPALRHLRRLPAAACLRRRGAPLEDRAPRAGLVGARRAIAGRRHRLCAGRRRGDIRLTLHARDRSTLAVSYMAARSQRIAAIEACPVAIPALREAPAFVPRRLASVAGRFKAIDAQLTATATGIDCDLRP